jgi:hypothetical protein
MASKAFRKVIVAGLCKTTARETVNTLRTEYALQGKDFKYCIKPRTAESQSWIYLYDKPEAKQRAPRQKGLTYNMSDKPRKKSKAYTPSGNPRKKSKAYKKREATNRPKVGTYEHSDEFKTKQADPDKPKSNAGRPKKAPPKMVIKQKLHINDLAEFINKLNASNGIHTDIDKETAIKAILTMVGVDADKQQGLTIDEIEICTPVY